MLEWAEQIYLRNLAFLRTTAVINIRYHKDFISPEAIKLGTGIAMML